VPFVKESRFGVDLIALYESNRTNCTSRTRPITTKFSPSVDASLIRDASVWTSERWTLAPPFPH
jgi:hypothetical protein